MPISDLLASITGENAGSSSANVKETRNPAPKRKAEDDIGGSSAKTQRTAAVPNESSRTNGAPSSLSTKPKANLLPISKPDKQTNRATNLSTTEVSGENRYSTSHKLKPASTAVNGNGSRTTITSRPSGVAKDLGSASASKTEPKKRSFAEIMARANAAAGARATLGKIQHKTVERGMSMKERKELRAEEARSKKVTGKLGNRASSSGRPVVVGDSRGRKQPGLQTGADQIPVEQKKMRKAAVATTGYTGTARPRPGIPSVKPGQPAERASEPRRVDRPHYPSVLSSSRRRYDEDDDDMDGFIEYDDDDDEPGYDRRRDYDSGGEDESDMEAGLSDIDHEERKADHYARQEDREQEALEKRLKREKEEKKRRQMAEIRAKASTR